MGLSPVLSASTSPASSPEDPASVWYLDRDAQERLELEGKGNAYGDLSLASGTLRKTREGTSVGTYTERTLAAGVAIPGGRRHEEVLLALHLDGGTILAASLRTGNAGTPPQRTFTYAVIGGTGDYRGERGALVLTGLSATTTEVRLVPAE